MCYISLWLIYQSIDAGNDARKKLRFFWIAKRVISIFVNLRYLRLKLLKNKENNKNIYDTFDHNFKNIYLCIMSYVSFERQHFVLYDGALALKMSKMALNPFCDETLKLSSDMDMLRRSLPSFSSLNIP